jgi:TolB protein
LFQSSLPTIARTGVVTLIAVFSTASWAAPLQTFDGQLDVGPVLQAGSAQYDAARDLFTVSGSGANMWNSADEFHFVWKRVSGDVALTADVSFLGTGGNPHRKAVLMMRQSLDGNSSAVDLAVHGSGMTALQYRDAAGANTHMIEFRDSSPSTVRILKRGDFFYGFASGSDGKIHPAGAATKLAFTGPFYIGIGVCAHDKNAVETAVFSHVKFDQLSPAGRRQTLLATLETIAVPATDRRVEYVDDANLQAPNWSGDGTFLVFNKDHRICRFAIGSSGPSVIDTGSLALINDDHGISPDGKLLAISDRGGADGTSRVYVLPIGGGTPREVTVHGPSYFHGWSPDGRTIVFSGERGANFDVYSVPAEGGAETRLTNTAGVDDGPEFSPDGASIYFHSDRTGKMQIWRMRVDGANPEQVLSDDSNDWFPHLSPDGKWMVFLAYDKSVSGHPDQKDVELRLMSLSDRNVRVLAKLFGGNGTINSFSWSPDSRRLAFVSYELLAEEDLGAR